MLDFIAIIIMLIMSGFVFEYTHVRVVYRWGGWFDDVIKLLKHTHTRVYFSNCHLPTHSLTHLFNVHMHVSCLFFELANFYNTKLYIYMYACTCTAIHKHCDTL